MTHFWYVAKEWMPPNRNIFFSDYYRKERYGVNMRNNITLTLVFAVAFLVAANVKADTVTFSWDSYFGPDYAGITLSATENDDATGVNFTFGWDDTMNGKVHDGRLYFWNQSVFDANQFQAVDKANYMTGGNVEKVPNYYIGGLGEENLSPFSFDFFLSYANGDWDAFIENPFTVGVHFQPTKGDSAGIWTTGIISPPTSTPEPATLAVLGLGLAGLAAARRRRK